jgi:SNF2-related domain
MHKTYTRYADFDADYGFSEKAGFQLSELQIKDVDTFVRWPAALNTYAVGGGKTVTSTAVALMRGCEKKVVTVPPVLITPWVRWLRKVTDNVLLYRGSPKERKEMSIRKAHWIVLSHAIFRTDHARLLSELGDSYELIVDEAHSIKNSGSVLFKKVQLLVGDAGYESVS